MERSAPGSASGLSRPSGYLQKCRWQPDPQSLDSSRGNRFTVQVELENAQAMAAHESPRTTKLYDRTGNEITLDEVERITI